MEFFKSHCSLWKDRDKLNKLCMTQKCLGYRKENIRKCHELNVREHYYIKHVMQIISCTFEHYLCKIIKHFFTMNLSWTIAQTLVFQHSTAWESWFFSISWKLNPDRFNLKKFTLSVRGYSLRVDSFIPSMKKIVFIFTLI